MDLGNAHVSVPSCYRIRRTCFGASTGCHCRHRLRVPRRGIQDVSGTNLGQGIVADEPMVQIAELTQRLNARDPDRKYRGESSTGRRKATTPAGRRDRTTQYRTDRPLRLIRCRSDTGMLISGTAEIIAVRARGTGCCCPVHPSALRREDGQLRPSRCGTCRTWLRLDTGGWSSR